MCIRYILKININQTNVHFLSRHHCKSQCVCVYIHIGMTVEHAIKSNRSDQQRGQRHLSSQGSHRTMGLFLWCNRSIRQNKGRACCSACASSIMHTRCTDRILLVKHDTCKSPALSLVWLRSVRGPYVAIRMSEAFRFVVIALSLFCMVRFNCS